MEDGLTPDEITLLLSVDRCGICQHVEVDTRAPQPVIDQPQDRPRPWQAKPAKPGLTARHDGLSVELRLS